MSEPAAVAAEYAAGCERCGGRCVRCGADGCNEFVEGRFDSVEVLVQHVIHTPTALGNVALD